MKEYLAVLGPLIRRGTVGYYGKEFNVTMGVSVPGATPCPILLAALAPKMLALAGAEAEGTITWMTGPRTVRDHIVPRIRSAAATAGRPPPRIVVELPLAVTTDVSAARASAARRYRRYGTLPSYRAMLEREGVEGPGDVAVVGDESTVGEQLARLAEAGATDFLANPFPVDRAADSLERTRALLLQFAARQ
jgi:F420-dependent oxidoreductase-like protein